MNMTSSVYVHCKEITLKCKHDIYGQLNEVCTIHLSLYSYLNFYDFTVTSSLSFFVWLFLLLLLLDFLIFKKYYYFLKNCSLSHLKNDFEDNFRHSFSLEKTFTFSDQFCHPRLFLVPCFEKEIFTSLQSISCSLSSPTVFMWILS